MTQKLEPNNLPQQNLQPEVLPPPLSTATTTSPENLLSQGQLPPRAIVTTSSATDPSIATQQVDPSNTAAQASTTAISTKVEELVAQGETVKAENLVESLQDPEQKTEVCLKAGRRLAGHHPQRGRDFLRRGHHSSHGIHDDLRRARIQNEIALAQAEAHDDCRPAFADSRESSRHVKDAYDRAGIQRDIGTNMAKAAKFYDEQAIVSDLRNGSKETFGEARVSAREITDPEKRAEMMGSIAKAMESSGFDASDAYAEAARAYAQTEAVQCRKDNQTTAEAVQLAERGDYASAIREANSIQDEYRRNEALKRIAKVSRTWEDNQRYKDLLIQAKVSA